MASDSAQRSLAISKTGRLYFRCDGAGKVLRRPGCVRGVRPDTPPKLTGAVKRSNAKTVNDRARKPRYRRLYQRWQRSPSVAKPLAANVAIARELRLVLVHTRTIVIRYPTRAGTTVVSNDRHRHHQASQNESPSGLSPGRLSPTHLPTYQVLKFRCTSSRMTAPGLRLCSGQETRRTG